MSFIRDRDAHTRGVNAIAAYDEVSPRGRNAQRIRTRAMAIRDRKLAAIAGGAVRRADLGRIDITRLGGRRTANIVESGAMEVGPLYTSGTLTPGTMTPPGGGGSGGGSPGRSLIADRILRASRASAQLVSVAPKGTTRPPVTGPRGGGTTLTQPTGPIIDPVFTGGGSSGGGGGSSGGGGGGGGSSGGGGGGDSYDDEALDPSTAPTPSTPEPSNKTRNLVIAGVALLAGWYLLQED